MTKFGLFLLAFTTAVIASSSQVARAQPLPGQLIVDPDDTRWLKRVGGGHLFICGPGGPAEILYHGTRNADTRAGNQFELIRKLIGHGGNCISMQAVRTHWQPARERLQ